jgi:hypothetical protein
MAGEKGSRKVALFFFSADAKRSSLPLLRLSLHDMGNPIDNSLEGSGENSSSLKFGIAGMAVAMPSAKEIYT